MTKLLLLFIVVPTFELILLIEIGQIIGTLPTIGLIIFTGIFGAFLARRQGIKVLIRVREQLQAGQVPAGAIFDGAIILVAGAFLMTPGVLTDGLGFLCLIPATRRVIKRMIWLRIERAIRSGQIVTTFKGMPFQPGADEITIIDHDDYR